MIQTDRHIIVFDLETTGRKVSEARILSIGAVKVDYAFRIIDQFEALVNPCQPIAEDILQLTGLNADDISAASPFLAVAHELAAFMAGCDLAGYNITRFDLPILSEEFARLGMYFPDPSTRVIDAQVIFHTFAPRTLAAALKHYVGREHDNPHDAMADTLATLEVLQAQLATHSGAVLPRQIEGLHEFSLRGKGLADWSRMLYLDEEGKLRYNFGKFRDRRVLDDFFTESYALYMLRNDFPEGTKNYLREFLYQEGVGLNADDCPL